jgi:ADP-ribosylglycohydrolase
MYGALIGDVEGSRFEFDNTSKRNFDLFSPTCRITDDSVMTLAVLDICRKKQLSNPKAIIDTFRRWGKRHPDAGYGSRFYSWLLLRKDYEFNHSYGNGAAMRISPVGFLAETEQEVRIWSKAVTEVSHDHPEGLKGAEVTAMCIFYARNKKSKEFIQKYAEKQYDLFPDYQSLCRSNHGHGLEICQVSVPQAISAFLLSNSFEDCLRIIISAGGDCDTTAAIACPIAEAFYGENGVDPKLIEFVDQKLVESGEKEGVLILHDEMRHDTYGS